MDSSHIQCTSVDVQNGCSRARTRQREDELSVEASWPPQRRIDSIRTICRTNNHYLSSGVQTIHEREQSRYDRCVDLVLLNRSAKHDLERIRKEELLINLPDRSKAIDLIEEDNGGLEALGLLK